MTDRRRGAEAARTGAGRWRESEAAESGEGRGHRAERDSIADGTALRCGRGGSRHFREIEEKSPGYLVFVSATLLICLPFKKLSE